METVSDTQRYDLDEPPLKKTKTGDHMTSLGSGDNSVPQGDSEATITYEDSVGTRHEGESQINGYHDNEEDATQRYDDTDEQSNASSVLIPNNMDDDKPSVDNSTKTDSEPNCDPEPTASNTSYQESQEAGPSSPGWTPGLHKVPSVLTDAQNIAGMLGLADVEDVVYQRLCQLRDKGNRTDLVTNELLEDGVERLRERVVQVKEEQGDSGIFQEIGEVQRRVLEQCPKVELNLDEVFALLEAQLEDKDRVGRVVTSLVQKYSAGKVSESTAKSPDPSANTDVIHDIKIILKEVPTADPSKVLDLFETHRDKQKVINLLKDPSHETPTATEKTTPLDLTDNPLFHDMQHISAVFPNRDKNEIYAYLEAHFQRPNRVQLVLDELLQMEGGTQEDRSVPADPSIARLQRDVSSLKRVFPDCDPNYLYEQLESMSGDRERVDRLSGQMFDKRNYPKLKDRLDKERKVERIRRLQNLELDLDEFIEMFPDPEAVFDSTEKEMSGSYLLHAEAQLQNDFPMLSVNYLKRKLKANKDHYLATWRECVHVALLYHFDPTGSARSHKRFLVTQRPGTKPMPEHPDDWFYKELFYARNEQRIKDHLTAREEAKTRRLAEARDRGELQECPCCYDDEVLFEDMLACPDGHLFCQQCVRRLVDAGVGDARATFVCLDGDCDLEYTLPALQTVLPAKLFSLVLRCVQEDQIRQADIPDLVTCPFCSFATIMSNPEDKVFKCLNSDCLKESCRLCREPSHIPLRCDEVEKDAEKDMRAYIETRMSEAMIRVCHRCQKRFFKTEGCNKMTCTCGASMCYVCREPITGYEHFTGQNCTEADAIKLHAAEMERAATDARAEYIRDHPEAAGTQLKHDPTKHLTNTQPQGTIGYQAHPDSYDGDDDDDEEDDDYDDSDDEDEDDYAYY